jgi:hypothetical protein
VLHISALFRGAEVLSWHSYTTCEQARATPSTYLEHFPFLLVFQSQGQRKMHEESGNQVYKTVRFVVYLGSSSALARVQGIVLGVNIVPVSHTAIKVQPLRLQFDYFFTFTGSIHNIPCVLLSRQDSGTWHVGISSPPILHRPLDWPKVSH